MTLLRADDTAPAVDLTRLDYTDHFRLTVPGPGFDDLDAFLVALATRQPGWLTQVSLGLRRRSDLEAAVARTPLEPGDAIGNWQILERRGDTVAVGEDLGIMRYRVVYRLLDARRVDACTEVMLTSRWFGPVYWRLATPLHRRFLPMMLRNTVEGSTVEALD